MNILFIYQPTLFYTCDSQMRWPLSKFIHMAVEKANPRTLEYCIKSALDPALSNIQDGDILRLLATAESMPNDLHNSFETVMTASNPRELVLQAGKMIPHADKVILLYPDAIGQGFEPLEDLIIRNGKTPHAISGRKRFLVLTPTIRRGLAPRRFIEKRFVFEVMFSVIFPLWILPFCVYERLTRHRFHSPQQGRSSSGTPKIIDSHASQAEAIREYWASRPQTYGLDDGQTTYGGKAGEKISVTLGEKAFFDRVDATFYEWNKPIHSTKKGEFIPFGKIFEYDRYEGKKVLEIGCGMGTMAMNWARSGADFHAIDLAPTSIEQTRRRFEVYGLKGTILQADARRLPFDANTFDYVYSWGVLHHSPDIAKSLAEVYRVLKPAGRIGMMLYYRKSFLYRYFVEYVEGFLHFEKHFLSPVALASRYGDGAREEGNPYTYPVTRDEVMAEIMPQFRDIRMKLFGTDIEWLLSYMCFPYSRWIPLFIRKSLARRFGWSLWITATR